MDNTLRRFCIDNGVSLCSLVFRYESETDVLASCCYKLEFKPRMKLFDQILGSKLL
jgi:hypothetical protein